MAKKTAQELLSDYERERLLKQKDLVKKRKQEVRDGLPHLHGFKFYHWSRAFFESTNKMCFLVAGNQLSKSSSQIRKAIDWATDVKKHATLWPNRTPRIFWYLYPSVDVATVEYQKKWVPEFLPRNEFKTHPIYGWREEKEKRKLKAIHFNSGVSIYFKTYEQDSANLQSTTLDAVFCFTASTLVMTKMGLKPISSIVVGDMVLTGKMRFKKVVKVFKPRLSEVITRKFSNGATICATPDHPFSIGAEGFRRFSDLTSKDMCVSLPAWKQTKKLYYSKMSYLLGTLKMGILGSAITSALKVVGLYTLPFGKLVIKWFYPKVIVFTTQILTPLTITFQTCNCCRWLSIPGFIKKQNGAIVENMSAPVKDAVRYSRPEALKKKLNTVLCHAVEFIKKLFVCPVRKNLLPEKILQLKPVGLTVEQNLESTIKSNQKLVYNFEVEEDHTYFANGILVHNCDEELPEHHFHELTARLFASNGYYSMVFTATLGQDIWLRTMEGKGDNELFPDAFKLQVSMYDCQTYEDGTPGAFPLERIKEIEAKCATDAEIQKRVHGRFIQDGGRKYTEFSPLRHMVKPVDIPKDWKLYAGVDIGSGMNAQSGKLNHPAAITFLAVRPDFQFGYVYKGWRGDFVQTTAGDILNKFIELRGEDIMTQQNFDQNSRDFGIMAAAMGESFEKSEKSHEIGEQVLNTLFKNDMLKIFDTPELTKLGTELSSLLKGTSKQVAKDDFIDSLRYASTKVPWDFSAIKVSLNHEAEEVPLYQRLRSSLTPEELVRLQIMERRGDVVYDTEEFDPVEEEFDYWNEAYGN